MRGSEQLPTVAALMLEPVPTVLPAELPTTAAAAAGSGWSFGVMTFSQVTIIQLQQQQAQQCQQSCQSQVNILRVSCPAVFQPMPAVAALL